MSQLPDIPDAAFHAAAERIVTFLNVTPAGRTPDMDAFCQSVGLRGQRDSRQWGLAAAVVAADLGVDDFDGKQLPPEIVRAHVQGITTGLLLAQAAGWHVPLSDQVGGVTVPIRAPRPFQLLFARFHADPRLTLRELPSDDLAARALSPSASETRQLKRQPTVSDATYFLGPAHGDVNAIEPRIITKFSRTA